MIKINVTGKGMYIPILKSRVPVYNFDADKATVAKLLEYRQINVYTDSILITRANIDAIFSASKPVFKAKTNAPATVHAAEAKPVVAAPVVETKDEPVVEPVIETPVVETKEEPVLVGIDLAHAEDTTDVETEAPVEDVEEAPVVVEETADEDNDTKVEERPAHYSKKKRKNRNNG